MNQTTAWHTARQANRSMKRETIKEGNMPANITVHTYRPEDLPALVALINEADDYDQLERRVTLEGMQHEMTWPNYHPETDCFLAWKNGRLVAYADFLMRPGEENAEALFYTWGMVHPRWRRLGIGRHLMETLHRRAVERHGELGNKSAYFQGSGRDIEEDRRALFEGLGMQRVRYFVNMVRPIDNGLPPVEMPPGFRLRTFDPARDVETVWQVDVDSFQDHWGWTGFPFEEFQHWVHQPHFRPELWLIAAEDATGKAAGICLNKVDPEWIAQTGRQEGLINTLGVLREYRRLGLGTALLAQSMRTLRQAGMDL
ncbi:MAG: GNAT family N-acetyltransferase, partial [Chloroflexi bacterium]